MGLNQKLELTWIGKEKEIKLEPRIMLLDEENSYGEIHSDNMLIHGDNLLALKALEEQYTNKIKCIYIDPPFNTGTRINADGQEVGYEDGLEHSEWLNMMSCRLKHLYTLLRDDGVIIVHLDDNEMAYCKVLMDEIWGRNNIINTITLTTNEPSGFKATGVKIFSTANYLLIYAKDRRKVEINKVFKRKGYDKAYSKIFQDINKDFKEWEWSNIKDFVCKERGFINPKDAIMKIGENKFNKLIEECAIKNADRVFRTAAIGGGAKTKRQKTINVSKQNRNEIFVHPNEDVEDFYILNGEQVIFYKKRLEYIDGELAPAEILTDVWTDISWTGIANEGQVVFKNGKKPELLLKRLLELFTNEGDWVLDSFLGSGTTAAVAHKMNRKWIGIELGEHCYTHCIPRLQRVIDGEQGGISKYVNWQGGGGFKFNELAASLLKQDRYGNWIINTDIYKANMVAAAVAKYHGFIYSPHQEVYWKQGYSFEKDYIFTTDQPITIEYIDLLHSEMQPGESLLICCPAYQPGVEERYENINVQKIPQSILDKYDFGVESYSMSIDEVVMAEVAATIEEEE